MNLKELETQIKVNLNELKTELDCNNFHAQYLGKSGEITAHLNNLRNLAPEERSETGKVINILKRETEQSLFKLQKEIKEREINQKLMNDKLVDITIPDLQHTTGSLHPITRTQREVEDAFRSMGFIIEQGNELVTEYECFTSLNVPENHPARDMQDTFFLEKKNISFNEKVCEKQVLRTHTTAMHSKLYKKYGPEFRAIFPGRCYRNESVDASHDMAFFQVDGLMVGKDISIANLIYFMKEVLSTIFKKEIKVRLRPGFFPFTEPSFELDASCIFCDQAGCSVCKQSGWIEFCGCGMTHPNVLEMGGIDPTKYTSFAFGFGLTRLVMMKYDVHDIRVFNSGNIEILKSIK